MFTGVSYMLMCDRTDIRRSGAVAEVRRVEPTAVHRRHSGEGAIPPRLQKLPQ